MAHNLRLSPKALISPENYHWIEHFLCVLRNKGYI